MGGEDFGGLTFLHNTKPSSFEGTKKLYWRRVLGGLGGSWGVYMNSSNLIYVVILFLKLKI